MVVGVCGYVYGYQLFECVYCVLCVEVDEEVVLVGGEKLLVICCLYCVDGWFFVLEYCLISLVGVFEVLEVDFVIIVLGSWLLQNVFWMCVQYCISVWGVDDVVVVLFEVKFGMVCLVIDCLIWCGEQLIICVWQMFLGDVWDLVVCFLLGVC